MEYGKRLNPERSLRTPKEIKGTRQKVIVTQNPSEIDRPGSGAAGLVPKLRQ